MLTSAEKVEPEVLAISKMTGAETTAMLAENDVFIITKLARISRMAKIVSMFLC